MKKNLFVLMLTALLTFSLIGCGGGGGGGGGTPNISVSATSVDFSGVVVGNSYDQTITITNTGNANLGITNVAVSGTEFSIVFDNASGETVSASGSRTFGVRYTPAAQGNSAGGTVTITSTDPDTPSATVTLAGEGYGLNVWINDVTGSCGNPVSVDVMVTDGGIPITDLVKAEFSVYANGGTINPAGITFTPYAATSPISLVLDVDYSLSLQGIIADVKSAGQAFINGLDNDDSAAICKFTQDLYFSPENGLTITDAGGKAALDSFLQANNVDVGTQTHLYDAAYESITRASDGTGAPAVVILSDGSDSNGSGGVGSTYTLSQVIAHANDLHVPIFTVFYVDEAYNGGTSAKPTIMQQLASDTGGQYYNANTADVDAILAEISEVLNNKYTLTFTPTCSGTLSVEVRVLDAGSGKYGQGSKTAD